MTSEMTLEVFVIALSANVFLKFTDIFFDFVFEMVRRLLHRLTGDGKPEMMKSVTDPCQHCGGYDPELGCMTPYFAREAGCNPDKEEFGND